MNKIEEFIFRRFPDDCNWLSGNCYYFALILKDRFPEGIIVYDVIYGHFLLKVSRCVYDFKGKHNIAGKILIEWDKFDKYDPLVKTKIIRDCIK